MANIKYLKHHEVTGAVLDAFMRPPPLEDPNHIKLREASLALARKVFHSKEA